MLLALIAAHAGAVDAERAFAARAAQGGQWAAFREFSTAEAVMFVPDPVNAHEWLAQQPEPPVTIQWWPADSFVSCDGSVAVNTGPWAVPSQRAIGFFTTVWVRQGDAAMKWVYDGGGALKSPRAAGDRAKVRRAHCSKPAEVPAVRYADGESGEGGSADRTLQWRWHVAADGARNFDAWLWNGRAMAPIVADRFPAPAKPS